MRHLAQFVVITAAMLLAQCGLVGGDVITVDPNTPEASAAASIDATDTRLAQKVSYECKSKPTREIMEDLSAMTGVAFVSGKNRSDWQVRDAKMIIFVKDVPLAELMGSMARVMRFRWSRNGEGPNWSYRLVDDEEAVRKVEARLNGIDRELAQRRAKTLKRIREVAGLSEDDLNKLKTENPYLYLMGITGSAKAYVNLAGQVPGLEKSKTKKPKQNAQQASGRKGGAMNYDDMGAPQPVRKKKK